MTAHGRHVERVVRGAVVTDNHPVYKMRNTPENPGKGLGFVESRNEDR
jgi:hypothetical protein